MTYPINKEKMLVACEQELGPAEETVKELFSLYIDEINRAYHTGLEQGLAEVYDFRDKVVDRLGDLCSWNDYNSLVPVDIVENIDDVLKEVQEND